MRKASVLYKGKEAGVLIQEDDGSFVFRYHKAWNEDSNKPGISLTLPKVGHEYRSEFLFPFFYNMLPEGSNKQAVCKHHKIEHDDHFGLLMAIAGNDTIGAVTVAKMDSP